MQFSTNKNWVIMLTPQSENPFQLYLVTLYVYYFLNNHDLEMQSILVPIICTPVYNNFRLPSPD